MLIDAGICIERRSMVYFKHPWPQLLVEHDIEAEKFEAAIGLFLLAAAIDVL